MFSFSSASLTRQQQPTNPDDDNNKHSHQISLYAHITGLAFALDELDAPVQRATISDASGAQELRTVSIDASGRTPFETANEIWAML